MKNTPQNQKKLKKTLNFFEKLKIQIYNNVLTPSFFEFFEI
jgi:hypothetical protein